MGVELCAEVGDGLTGRRRRIVGVFGSVGGAMDLVGRLCPEIVVLEAGRVLAVGKPAEVLARRDVMDAYLGVSED
jgi:ABC-type branched-subunit amino acid transport system ATPase component